MRGHRALGGTVGRAARAQRPGDGGGGGLAAWAGGAGAVSAGAARAVQCSGDGRQRGGGACGRRLRGARLGRLPRPWHAERGGAARRDTARRRPGPRPPRRGRSRARLDLAARLGAGGRGGTRRDALGPRNSRDRRPATAVSRHALWLDGGVGCVRLRPGGGTRRQSLADQCRGRHSILRRVGLARASRPRRGDRGGGRRRAVDRGAHRGRQGRGAALDRQRVRRQRHRRETTEERRGRCSAGGEGGMMFARTDTLAPLHRPQLLLLSAGEGLDASAEKACVDADKDGFDVLAVPWRSLVWQLDGATAMAGLAFTAGAAPRPLTRPTRLLPEPIAAIDWLEPQALWAAPPAPILLPMPGVLAPGLLRSRLDKAEATPDPLPPHPLAALLPCPAEGPMQVATTAHEKAYFAHLAPELDGPAIAGHPAGDAGLLHWLGRTIEPAGDPAARGPLRERARRARGGALGLVQCPSSG